MSTTSERPAPSPPSSYGTAVWSKRFDIADDTWTKSGRTIENKTKLHGIDGALGMPAFTAWYGAGGRIVGVLTHDADEDYERGGELIAQGARWSW